MQTRPVRSCVHEETNSVLDTNSMDCDQPSYGRTSVTVISAYDHRSIMRGSVSRNSTATWLLSYPTFSKPAMMPFRSSW